MVAKEANTRRTSNRIAQVPASEKKNRSADRECQKEIFRADS